MTQQEVEAKLAELELAVRILTEATGMLAKTVASIQDNLELLVTKLAQTLKAL